MLFKLDVFKYQKQLIWFTHQFLLLHEAGMGFAVSLKTLQSSCHHPDFSLKIGRILRAIERGQSFSEGLAKYPEIFPIFYIEMVKVGEQTGKLSEILLELKKYWELKQGFWQNLIQALVYPAVVMGLMVILTFGLCFTIVPRFEQIFTNFHASLPWPTKILFNSVNVLQHHFIVFMTIGACFIWGTWKFIKKQGIYFQQDQRILKFPGFGSFYQAILLLNFFKVLGIALKAGLSLQSAVSLLPKMFRKTPFKNLPMLIEYDLAKGRRLTEIFARRDYFPEYCLGFIHVAEETGALDNQFLHLAAIFEAEVKVKLERFKVLLEPIMILIAGLMVGGVVMALYYPIFSLGSAI